MLKKLIQKLQSENVDISKVSDHRTDDTIFELPSPNPVQLKVIEPTIPTSQDPLIAKVQRIKEARNRVRPKIKEQVKTRNNDIVELW